MENFDPKVYYAPTVGVEQKKNWFRPKIIFLAVMAIIGVEIIIGIITLLSPIPGAKPVKVQPISGAKILLVSQKETYQVGEKIPVLVRVFTGGHFSKGTDVVFRYDPKVVAASQRDIIKGSLYPDYPVALVNEKSGIISISGISSGVSRRSDFIGMGELGIVNFTAKQPGVTNFTIDFQSGSTNNSTVVDSSSNQNVLDGVSDLRVTIR